MKPQKHKELQQSNHLGTVIRKTIGRLSTKWTDTIRSQSSSQHHRERQRNTIKQAQKEKKKKDGKQNWQIGLKKVTTLLPELFENLTEVFNLHNY